VEMHAYIQVLESTSSEAKLNAHNQMLKTGTLEIVRDFQKEVVALVNKFKHSKDSKERAGHEKDLANLLGLLDHQVHEALKGLRAK